jgi:hypothetical protein
MKLFHGLAAYRGGYDFVQKADTATSGVTICCADRPIGKVGLILTTKPTAIFCGDVWSYLTTYEWELDSEVWYRTPAMEYPSDWGYRSGVITWLQVNCGVEDPEPDPEVWETPEEGDTFTDLFITWAPSIQADICRVRTYKAVPKATAVRKCEDSPCSAAKARRALEKGEVNYNEFWCEVTPKDVVGVFANDYTRSALALAYRYSVSITIVDSDTTSYSDYKSLDNEQWDDLEAAYL